MSSVMIPSLNLNDIINEVQDNVLFKLFGSEYINVRTLLNNVSQLNNSDEYEFEMRFVDKQNQTSTNVWHSFTERDYPISLSSYDDDVVYSYLTTIPISNIHFRSYEKTGIYERKMLINSVLAHPDSSIIPLKINFSKESSMNKNKEMKKFYNIQRRQRCSYIFNDESSNYLKNWRIDKTLRLYAKTLNDKKLSLNLDIYNMDNLNYYDKLDIEFEYIGPFSEIKQSFFELINVIYKPYEFFNMKYQIIKNVMSYVIPPQKINGEKTLLSLIPKPQIMTNDILHTLSIKNFCINYKYNGSKTLFVCFGSSDESYVIYSLTNKNIKRISGHLDMLSIGKESKPSSIAHIIDSFIENKHNCKAPPIYVFEGIENEKYMFLDTIIFNNELVESKILQERKAYIYEFFDTFNLNESFVSTDNIKINTWSNLLDQKMNSYVIKPLTTSIFNSTTYKIAFHEQIAIKFKVEHVPSKRLFYLYTMGNINQVINSKTINNKYSSDHFGYLLTDFDSSTDMKYLLYISPYIKESFSLKPSISSTNPILKDMYVNPYKYNGLIIKMTRKNDSIATWEPMEIDDAKEPDTYIDALKLESLIFDPLHISQSVVKQSFVFKSIYGSILSLIDQYIAEKYVSDGANRVLDIINDDRDNSIMLYKLNQVKNIFVTSDNKHALISYIDAAINRSNKTMMNSIYLNSEHPFSINVIHSSLKNNDMIYELNRKWCYTPKSINAVYFEDAFEQLTSLIDIIKFRNVCDEVLSPNGKILFKIFDGTKIIDLLKHGNQEKQKSTKKRRTTTSHQLKIELSYEKKIDTVLRTKTTSKQMSSLIGKSKIVVEGSELKCGNKTYSIPQMYDLSSLTHEQLNSLIIVADYYNKIDEPFYKPINQINLNNLKHIFGITVELCVNSMTRTSAKYYSEHYEIDKLTGACGSVDSLVDGGQAINENVIIIKEFVDHKLSKYIESRKYTSYSTLILTTSILNIEHKFKLNNNNWLYVLYPSFVSLDDIMILENYMHQYVLPVKVDDLFKFYSHPTLKCSYVQRLAFNLDFLKLMNKKFKQTCVMTPLTQKEIATTIATNQQFSSFEMVESYLSTYTFIVFERA